MKHSQGIQLQINMFQDSEEEIKEKKPSVEFDEIAEEMLP